MATISRNGSTTLKVLLACVVAVTLGYPRPACPAEQKIALVIGNAAYPTSRLRNPVNDAKAMADKLRALGFEVILHTDSNLREMTRSFSQFGQKLALGSVGLFYYAGHGMQVQGKNFLIPVDAEIESEASVRTEAVDVDQLLHQLGPARLSMVILDACRNNPFERRFRGARGGLAQIDAPTGTLLAYATAPGKVAADGTGSNGLYTEALLKALDLPGLKVEDIFKQVRINVVKASDGQQTPWESSSLTGEFYFTPDNKPALADEKLKQSEKERAELAKALDEERRKRDKDSELVRAEMEKLRAELLKIRTDVRATQSAAAPQVAENDKTQREERTRAEAERKRLNALAIAEPEATKEQVLAQAEQTASAASTTGTKVNSPPAIVAMIAPAGSAPTTVDELPLRIALLEKLHGQLTFTKAISLLLDITSTENLIQVTLLEKILQDGGFANALAIGMNAQGNAVWAGTARFRNIPFAEESALESCAKAPDTSCKVVLANGTFREKVFLEWALQLRGSNLMHLRETFLKSVAASPNEMRTFGGGLGNSGLNVAKLFTPNLSLR